MLAPDFRPCEFAPTRTLVCGGACGIKQKKNLPLSCLRIKLPSRRVWGLGAKGRVHGARGPGRGLSVGFARHRATWRQKVATHPAFAFKSIFHSTPTTGGGSPNEKCSQNSTWPINATFATHLGRRKGPKSENFPRAYYCEQGEATLTRHGRLATSLDICDKVRPVNFAF